MVKVITGYKVKTGQDIQPILFKLRAHAMTFPGYIGSENLIGETDRSIIAQISTWEKMEHWKDWEYSAIRIATMRELAPALQEEPRITIYRVAPASGWTYVPRGS